MSCHVLKFGHRAKSSEAVAMKLVVKETDVRLPEWLAEGFPCDREEGYLWMTCIPGSRLDISWGKLRNDTKQRLCQDVWEIVAEIRKIRCPSEYQQFFQCAADGSITHDPLIENLENLLHLFLVMLPYVNEYTNVIYITVVDDMRRIYLICFLSLNVLFSLTLI